MTTRKRFAVPCEARTTTVDTQQLRLAISALANAAGVAAEALKVGDGDQRARGRAVIDDCVAGLAALAFAQIPKETP